MQSNAIEYHGSRRGRLFSAYSKKINTRNSNRLNEIILIAVKHFLEMLESRACEQSGAENGAGGNGVSGSGAVNGC